MGHSVCTESNNVEPIFILQNIQCSSKNRSFEILVLPSGIQTPPTIPSGFNAFIHPLGTKRNIPIESRGLNPLLHLFCPESNDESCFILIFLQLSIKKGLSQTWLYHLGFSPSSSLFGS